METWTPKQQAHTERFSTQSVHAVLIARRKNRAVQAVPFFPSSNSFGFSYDALSRRTSLTRPNGVNSSYGYDSLSRLLSVLHQASGVTLDGAVYTYDNAGNRLSKLNELNGVTENYTYDPIYQLTQVQQVLNGTPSVSESYSYDLVGNRLSSLNVASYSYNSSNELTSSSDGYSYTYDNNGNTLTKALGTDTTGFAWDFENRLTQVTLPGSGGAVAFKYDPFGRRVQKVSLAGTTNYLYDGANTAEELDASGTPITKYVQGLSLDEPLAMQWSTAYFLESDGSGSITSVSDSSASLPSNFGYGAFGNQAFSSGTVISEFRYTARDWDSETNLYYYRARYYQPSIGRFIGEDPLGFIAGNNFYSYVKNDPVNRIDPLGMQEATAAGCMVGGLAGCAAGATVDSLAWLGALALAAEAARAGQNPYSSPLLNYQHNQAKKKCANNGCKPCDPPVGTISYRLDEAGPPHRGIPTPHWHLYVMQQDPASCQCQWVDIADNQGGFGAGTPPSGTTPIRPASGGGRP